MDYKFDQQKGLFTLYSPETGKDWHNQLWNNFGFHTCLSHTGQSWSRYVDEESNQVTLSNMEILYLRDDDNKEFWNIGGMPTCRTQENYACEHGPEHTRISSTHDGIDGAITYVVAENAPYEAWKVVVKNNDTKERHISLFPYVMFDLNGFKQPIYYSASTTTETMYVKDAHAILARTRNPFIPHETCQGYIATDAEVFAYEGLTDRFVGTVGSFASPVLLQQGRDLGNGLGTVRGICGMLQTKLTLAPGEEKTVHYLLGLCTGEEDLKNNTKARFEEAYSLFETAMDRGAERFGTLRTMSPNERINNMMNFWTQKQVSYCMIGKKAVRDNAQLALAMLNYDIPLAKKTIEECIEHQYKDGHAILTWLPFFETNTYSDPSVWVILTICELIKETGDFDYLNKQIPYLLDEESDTVYGHLKRAAEWFLREDNFGPNGLPKIHHADWNDALNIPDENGESVFMAMAICWAFDELAAMARYLKDDEYADYILAEKAKLADTVNEKAWNGEYYIRAISKFGKVGDKGCSTGGDIYVNPQSWGILADIIPADRLQSVLAAVDGMETEEGIPLCAPAYQEYDPTVGRMSGMLPGVYENGGIYNHAACFKIMADCKIGRRENALATLLKVMPNGDANPSSHTTCEPYVFTNCYLKHHTVDMLVGSAWQTGTSAWGLRSYYEGILGLVRTYAGLSVRPCFPESWDKITARRQYRGNMLYFTYINNNTGKMTLTVDGKEIEGNLIPLFDDNKDHEIIVNM